MKIGFIPVGDSSIELLQDVSGSSSIKKFLDNNGEGIHHIAFEVDDIEQAVAELKEKGIRLIDEKPRAGAHGMQRSFYAPQSDPRHPDGIGTAGGEGPLIRPNLTDAFIGCESVYTPVEQSKSQRPTPPVGRLLFV